MAETIAINTYKMTEEAFKIQLIIKGYDRGRVWLSINGCILEYISS
jgi:hypothetical protein